MRRICAYCNKEEGRVCGKCGGTELQASAITLTTPEGILPLFFRRGVDLQTYVIAAIFTCKNAKCGHAFNSQNEPLSHCCCNECYIKEAEKIN